MKPWARVVIVVAVLTAVSVWLLQPNNKAQRAAERTRESLRKEGFKLDLADFDISTPSGLAANNELLMLAADASRNMFTFRRLDLMRPVGSNSAMVTWSQENPTEGLIDKYFWPELRKIVGERSAILDRACEAVISGPFQFRTTLATNGELAPDVVRARLLGSAMAARTILELHEQSHSAAWTNLFALTRLVTAWQTEPMDVSHSIRFRWVLTAQRVTWEALQAKDWTDDELAMLQHEWESPNFFNGLPETAALARASTIEYCSFQRSQPPPPGPTLREYVSDLFNSPHRTWSDAISGWRNARYRNHESYDDERAWLLFFRECELDFRRALSAHSWLELRDLQSATNSRPEGASNFVLGTESSRGGPGSAGFQRQGPTLLARAAEAEARRRLLVTAIAIERFHLAHGCYPDSLSKLVPKFLKSQLTDYMDGEPLRYRRSEDDRFLLYSVGLDGYDDQGQLPAMGSTSAGSNFGREAPDLVWPMPASPAEVQAYAEAAESRRAQQSTRAMTSEGRQFSRSRAAMQAAGTNRPGVPDAPQPGPKL